MSSGSSETQTLPVTGFSRVRLVALLGLLVFLGLGAWALVHFLPLSVYNLDWILGENGNQIFRADQMHTGKALYRDIDCQYGPLPIWIWYAFTGIAGNTIDANVLFQSLLSIAFIGCLFWWLTQDERRGDVLVAVAVALALVSFARTPYLHLLITPVVNMEYFTFERFLLLAVMAVWRPVESRGKKHAVWLVLIFLAWQCSKVGGAFVALAAYGVMDVLWLAVIARRAEWLCGWIRWWGLAVCGLIVAEMLRCGLFVISSGGEQGMRSAWPLYVAEEYQRTWLTVFASFRHFVAVILPIAAPVILFPAFVFSMFRRSPGAAAPSVEAGHLLCYQSGVGVIFYLLGAMPKVGYFGHEWHFFQYQWILLPFTMAIVFHLWLKGRAVIGLLMILGLHAGAFKVGINQARSAFTSEFIDRVDTRIGPVMAPAGNGLLELVRTALELTGQNRSGPPARSLIIGTWGGSGWYVAANESHRPHNTFFRHPLIRRPSDNEEFARLLREADVLLIAIPPGPGGTSGNAAWVERVVGPDAWQQMEGDFTTRMKGAGGGQTAWELRVRKKEGESR